MATLLLHGTTWLSSGRTMFPGLMVCAVLAQRFAREA